jgi:DNA-binding beta-propeller fold protein YncE
VKANRLFCWISGAVIFCTPLLQLHAKSASKKGAAKETIVESHLNDLFWPLPPDPPRVRWLAEYTDMAKIKNPEAPKRGWLDKVTGAKSQLEKEILRKPYGIATDSWGRIYIADTELGVVFVIDSEAKTVAYRKGSGNAPMAMPAGVALDSENRLFVSDAQLHQILCFSPMGEVVASFGAKSLGRPGGIAIDPGRRRLYVADAKDSRIAIFDTRTFNLLGYFGKPSKGQNPEKGAFANPTNVAVDRQGNIYVADTFNCRVQILDPAGKCLRAFGTRGDRPGEFIRPKGIAVDSEGHVYVADAEFNNFQVLSPEGQPLLAVGKLGVARGEFGLIAGLHIDSKDRIYTTEMYIGRIQIFQYIAQPEFAYGKEVSGQSHLNGETTASGNGIRPD